MVKQSILEAIISINKTMSSQEQAMDVSSEPSWEKCIQFLKANAARKMIDQIDQMILEERRRRSTIKERRPTQEEEEDKSVQMLRHYNV